MKKDGNKAWFLKDLYTLPAIFLLDKPNACICLVSSGNQTVTCQVFSLILFAADVDNHGGLLFSGKTIVFPALGR